jgi:Peptidase inhibitor I78 family
MSVRVIRFLAVLLTALALIPAGGLAQPAPDRQACATGEAQALVGQPYSPERARRTAGAREVQKIEPGGAYTTDLNADRLNIEVDRAGVVTGLRCG